MGRKVTATAASRRHPPKGSTARPCAFCGRPLPAGSTPRRRFCSTGCRQRGWDRDNPRPDRLEDTGRERWFLKSTPAHFHRDPRGWTYLAAHRESPPWTGSSCPPECPGLREGETFAGPRPY
jgi:hypothetical protein